jgi:hypothetical protein
MEGIGYQAGTNIHIPDKPAQVQFIHQWNHGKCQRSQGYYQGYNKS